MSEIYERWEKLVEGVLKREMLKQLALSYSMSSCSSITQEEEDDVVSSHDDKGLKSAADSDTVWHGFRPRSVSPVAYASKKALYFILRRSPILTDAGKSSFSLEKKSGKKSYMVGAKELGIIWGGDTPRYRELTPHPYSRFSKVAHLKSDTRRLSPDTVYGAYLVFKLDSAAYGLESANAFVRFMDDEVEGEDERKAILDHFAAENGRDRDDGRSGEVPVRRGDGLTEVAMVHLQRQEQGRGRVGVERGDGWMEVELGSFVSSGGDDGAVEAWLIGREGFQWKSGLIVQGIEFHPKP